MTFDYIALNKSNDKVEGEISAEELSSARKRLHGMGLTVLAINERKTEDGQETKKDAKGDFASYEFKGIDKHGKEIIGTIDAKDELRAYIRLKNEFSFDVKYIFDLAASEMEKDHQKAAWAKELQQKYELAGMDAEAKAAQTVDDDLAEIENANIEQLNVLRNQVDVMVAQIKTVIATVSEDPTKRTELSQVKTLIGELERIKMSNNVKHIKSVAERILEMAESLLKNKEEFKVVIKQKKDLNAINISKLEDMQHREAVQIKGITGALEKASKLFKKYVKRLGINVEENQTLTSDKDLAKDVQESKNLLSDLDLVDKDKSDLKKDFKLNLSSLFGLNKTQKIAKGTAFQNLKTLAKALWTKKQGVKTEEDADFEQKTAEEISGKKVDKSKKDFQKVFIEINNFLGWLLCFYIAYFFIGGLVLQKNLNFLKTFFYQTVTSDFLLLLLLTLFVFHLLTHLKIKFFRQNLFAAVMLFSLGFFSVFVFALNY